MYYHASLAFICAHPVELGALDGLSVARLFRRHGRQRRCWRGLRELRFQGLDVHLAHGAADGGLAGNVAAGEAKGGQQDYDLLLGLLGDGGSRRLMTKKGTGNRASFNEPQAG